MSTPAAAESPRFPALIQLLARGLQDGPEAILRASAPPSGRPAESRRRYARDPHGYCRDILGERLTDQQERALDFLTAPTDGRSARRLIPSATAVGKTRLLSNVVLWRWDAVSAVLDSAGLEQGCIVLLGGPSYDSIFHTIYAAILSAAARAEANGHPMPGRRSERKVSWSCGPHWFMRAIAPAPDSQKTVSHRASGHHGPNMIAVLEEVAGLRLDVWTAIEGGFSAAGNDVLCPFNATEAAGPAYVRATDGSYEVLHLSAFDHPNVRTRTSVVPAAVSHRTIDDRVKAETVDRGRVGDIEPDPAHHDFVYALPPAGAPDAPGPRPDGIPGHPAGEPRVYRPGPLLTAQVLGDFPATSSTGLFDPAAVTNAMKRWRERQPPPGPPDRLGFDCAREGSDDSAVAPAWGPPSYALLRAMRDARAGGDIEGAVDRVIESLGRVYVGEISVAPKGDGPDVATWAARRFPDSPAAIDDGGVGASVLDYWRRVLGRKCRAISFGGRPDSPLPDERRPINLRTQLYVRAAELVRLGLVDLPPDEALREELMAHRLDYLDLSAGPKKGKAAAVALSSKDDVKKEIGRSPDRADAVVLGLVSLQLGPLVLAAEAADERDYFDDED